MPLMPHKYQSNSESGSEDEGTNYIDQVKELYSKRRGILKNTLDLSQNQHSHERLTTAKPFYDQANMKGSNKKHSASLGAKLHA